jgi:hypothetical protein
MASVTAKASRWSVPPTPTAPLRKARDQSSTQDAELADIRNCGTAARQTTARSQVKLDFKGAGRRVYRGV